MNMETNILAHLDAPPANRRGAERLRRRTRTAMLLVGTLAFAGFGLAGVLPIEGAVIANGSVAVDTNVNMVRHPEGGVLTALRVREGERVVAGQLLMQLESATSAAGARSAASGLEQLLARRARLEAERDGAAALRFPGGSESEAMARERRLFDLRRRERDGAAAQLGERVHQQELQIEGYRTQIEALREQARLIRPELDGLRQLYAKQLVTINRINQMERTAAQLRGSEAALQASIAEARARIAEIRAQVLNRDEAARSEAARELAATIALLDEQQARSTAAGNAFARSLIRAPQSGVIDRIAYSTIGSAVPGGEPLIEIVPDRDALIVQARVKPQDVDQLRTGQGARVLLSGLDRQTTPELAGTVTFVSPALTHDPRSGEAFYRVRIKLADSVRTPLRPGMPAEVFVRTGSRSMLSFLLKPLLDQIRRGFRDG